jgi:hypothetical protein
MTTAGRAVVLVATVVALALPGRAGAVDHVVLHVSPARLAATQSSALAPWRLSAAVVAASSPTAQETFGVSLTRRSADGRAEEVHGLRAAPAGTVTFDGRSGHWRARLGSTLAIRMTIAVTGPEQRIGESQGCRGDLVKVPVVLRGSFVLRTGTSFFRTIRRTALAGAVTFNRGALLECTVPASASCSPGTVFTAERRAARVPAATLLLSPDSGGWLTLSFAESIAAAPAGATWYHVMRLERLGFDPLAGRPPAFAVGLPPALAVRGDGVFTAGETTETTGLCRRVESNGRFSGSFSTRFTGWGTRVAAFDATGLARYAEATP